MNWRHGYLAQFGLAGCLILVGTCWVSGQQGRHGHMYRPQEDMRFEDVRADARFDMNGMPTAHTPLIGQRSTAVVGSCVKLSDGQIVGRVDDLMINEDGCVDFMVVSFNGSSEFRGRLAAIPWSVGKMDFNSKLVVLNVDRDTLREAPIFFGRGPAWPNLYEPQWAATVHNYFGVETDIDQRVERAYGRPDAIEGNRDTNIDMDRDIRRGDLPPQQRNLEQRRKIQQPTDRHLDAKPAPMPEDTLGPEPRLDRNGERSLQGKDRGTIRNNGNNDDEFSGKKSDRNNGERNRDNKGDDNLKEQDREDNSAPPPQ